MRRSNLRRMEPKTGELEVPGPREGERSEPDRGGPANGAAAGPAIPDPEVPAKAKRWLFTAQYKQEILAQADACREEGAIGESLRREGLYSSHLTTWRRQREEGALQALTPKEARPEADTQPAG